MHPYRLTVVMHHVEILAASECGHCRQITEAVTDTCLGCATDLEVHAIDLSRHPDVGRDRFGLLESPIVVVDGRVVSSGRAPAYADLVALLR